MSRMLDTFAATAAALTVADRSDELCCVFQRAWTVRAFGAEAVDRAPAKLWNLWPESGDAWAPVTACVLAGISVGPAAVAKPGDVVALSPGRWHRVQGWRGTPFAQGVTGHTISVYAPATGPEVLVFDSAKDRNEQVRWVVWTEYAAQYRGGMAAAVLREAAP